MDEWQTQSALMDERLRLECPACRQHNTYERPKRKNVQRIKCACNRAAVTIHWTGPGGGGKEMITECRICGGEIEAPTTTKTLCPVCRSEAAGCGGNRKTHTRPAWGR